MNEFLRTYHHPKNITFMNGGGGYNPIQPPSSYAAKHGPHRQSQVDTEIKRILKSGAPSKSKDKSKIHMAVTEDRQFVFHHHHHKAIVLKMPPRNSINEKWQLIWWWRDYEVATDERVMKAVMAGLQARFEDSGGSGNFYFEGSNPTQSTESITQTSQQSMHQMAMQQPSAKSIKQTSQKSSLQMMMQQPSANEKRKRAAAAAEQRSTNNDSAKKKSKPTPSEVIDLT